MEKLAQFHSQLYGPEDGRRWVFLHGLMGFSANWRKIIKGLEATERCLTYDQRGHGRSIKPAAGYAPENYADDLLEILNELGWEKIVLVGHSMGARNAMNFAFRFPERVEKLVLEDIGPEGNPQQLEYYQYLLGLVPTPFANRAEAKDFFTHKFAEVAKTRDRADVLGAYFYANMEDKPDGQVSWRFFKEGILESVRAGRDRDRWDELRQLKMPVLLIRGRESQELSPEVYARMLGANKMIKGVELGPSGHWVHADQPQAFIEALKDFVGVT